jgi:TIR domain
MDFDGDAFISYAHLDNIGLAEGHKGWVANLHRALEIRLAQLLGKQSRIWWDPKLQGNDVFSDTLVRQLRRVAAPVSVISPRYVRSEWGRKELAEFCKAAEEQGGIRVQDKAQRSRDQRCMCLRRCSRASHRACTFEYCPTSHA